MITLKPCTKPQEQRDKCQYCAQIGHDEEDIKKYPNVTFVPLSLCMNWHNENDGNGTIHACEPPKEKCITIEYEDKIIVIPKSKFESIEFKNADGTQYKKWYPGGLDELFDELLNYPEKNELSLKIAQMECSTFEQERIIGSLEGRLQAREAGIRAFQKERDDVIVRAKTAEKRIQELEGEVKILKGNLDLAGFTISSQAALLRKGYGLEKPVKKECRTCKYDDVCVFPLQCVECGLTEHTHWQPKE